MLKAVLVAAVSKPDDTANAYAVPARSTERSPKAATASTVAVIVTVRLATAVATPVTESIVATVGCIDLQWNRFPRISVPFASRASAVNCRGSPSAASVTLGGNSSTVDTPGGSVLPHAVRAQMRGSSKGRGRGRTEMNMTVLLLDGAERGSLHVTAVGQNGTPGVD